MENVELMKFNPAISRERQFPGSVSGEFPNRRARQGDDGPAGFPAL